MLIRKYNKIIFVAGFMWVMISISSCSKVDDFGATNQNPGSTTAPVTSALLTNVLAGAAGYTWDAGGITTVAGLYAQYYSETQYTDISIFNKSTPNWDGFYAGPLFDLQTIINYNTDPKTAVIAAANGSNANQIAVARILKAYIFSVLTDSYGDLPYSGALKGDNGIVAYDKQQDIYTDLFKELTEASAQFDGGLAFSGDILFNGDATQWKKFANSIRILLALRLSKVDAATGKTQFNSALTADGGVLDVGENIQLVFPGGNFNSPIYQYYDVTKRFDYAVSKTMTDWLASTNDPRQSVYGTSTIGFPFGLSRDNAVGFANSNPAYAQLLGGQGSSATDPFNILTSSEIFLARAEAAQLGWTSEDAATMYSTGISENFKLWGVYDATAFAAYMAQGNIDLSTGNEYQKIATMEWVSHYPAGNRGWSDWRRTGFPALVPGPSAVYPNIPRRFAYGPNEYSTNATNAKAAGDLYTGTDGSDSQFGRMWWDVQ